MLSIGTVQVFQGGMFRCCIAYLTEVEDLEEKSTDGATLECGYCTSPMIYKDGRWEWDKEKDGRWEWDKEADDENNID